MVRIDEPGAVVPGQPHSTTQILFLLCRYTAAPHRHQYPQRWQHARSSCNIVIIIIITTLLTVSCRQLVWHNGQTAACSYLETGSRFTRLHTNSRYFASGALTAKLLSRPNRLQNSASQGLASPAVEPSFGGRHSACLFPLASPAVTNHQSPLF
jgi:hypothetical protein